MADQDYGVFTPADCQRIWRTVKEFERLGGSVRSVQDFVGSTPVYFKNDSGEAIPAFSIVQLTDTVDDEGKVYYLAKKPIATTNALNDRFVVSGSREIPANGYGVAQEGPVYRIKTSGSLAVGTRLGPSHNAWTATAGIMFSHMGSDALETDVVRADRNESMLIGVATTGVTARSSTNMGSGTVAIRYLSISGGSRVITDAGYNLTAYNLASEAVASGAYVMLARVGPFPIVVWEECPP